MPDKYTLALQNLHMLPDGEFEEISACDPRVIMEKNTTLIQTKEQRWLYDLCIAISPSKEQSTKFMKPWPKYLPIRPLKKGGESILVVVANYWQTDNDGNPAIILFKFPRPIITTEKIDTEPPLTQGKRIVKTAGELIELTKSLVSPKKTRRLRRLEPPKSNPATVPSIADCQDVERFRRSFKWQGLLHQASIKQGLLGFGYIPKVFEFIEPNLCCFSQEYIDGIDYIEYVRTHSDTENLELFYKLVLFVERVIHGHRIAHCDLGVKNILVRDDIPIILDFGIAKGTDVQDITVIGRPLGNLVFSPKAQLQNSRERGWWCDIVSLGRILWVTLARRIPPVKFIEVWTNTDGILDYDESQVVTQFDIYSIPEAFRGIYEATKEFPKYSDISEFRIALESILYLQHPEVINTGCSFPCEEIIALQERIKKLEALVKKQWLAIKKINDDYTSLKSAIVDIATEAEKK